MCTLGWRSIPWAAAAAVAAALALTPLFLHGASVLVGRRGFCLLAAAIWAYSTHLCIHISIIYALAARAAIQRKLDRDRVLSCLSPRVPYGQFICHPIRICYLHMANSVAFPFAINFCINSINYIWIELQNENQLNTRKSMRVRPAVYHAVDSGHVKWNVASRPKQRNKTG